MKKNNTTFLALLVLVALCLIALFAGNCQAGGEPTCFGILSSSSKVCSGKGECTDEDTCECKRGFFGNQCQITHCYGHLSTGSGVCSSQGKCISPNKCICDAGYRGHKCHLPAE